ncbi:L-threonylcarbamoyladenylate synthase [Desulfurobacterium pacificum]|uniref:L-threonylcarbamoyladenylate synthase n=1 Tax=Desulfurobacterium pacificum TaxID=240166 RepID=A0ABY1NJK9_9BACT|nr:L-threonylcarbamoyladenylate synthase [Desulfurobacterium pacificum]SMP11335.1 L-threonylcarbamoyladenylate synthase [Desulfurobacterium pacificum]
MKVIKKDNCVSEVIHHLKEGKIVCFPTDTIYGLLGNPMLSDTLKKVYEIKGRDKDKPLILLFGSIEQMENLGVEVKQKEVFSSLWPAPLTVVFPLRDESPLRKVLNRDDVAVRIPDDAVLLQILEEVYPLFAPSANPQGLTPARNCQECIGYFGNSLSLCVEGKCGNQPSTLIKFTSDRWEVLREGSFPLSKLKEALG